MGKLVLIDGNAVMHRAYHALPPLTTRAGEPINAVYGLVSMLLNIIEVFKPNQITVAFDRPEPTFRHKKFKAYQSQRPEMDKELSSQFAEASKVLMAMNVPVYSKAGFEADDVIGTIATKVTDSTETNKHVDSVIIVTGDRDILQLVSDTVGVFLPAKGLSEGKVHNSQDVVEKMGGAPGQIGD